jgi:hypothetical protein
MLEHLECIAALGEAPLTDGRMETPCRTAEVGRAWLAATPSWLNSLVTNVELTCDAAGVTSLLWDRLRSRCGTAEAGRGWLAATPSLLNSLVTNVELCDAAGVTSLLWDRLRMKSADCGRDRFAFGELVLDCVGVGSVLGTRPRKTPADCGRMGFRTVDSDSPNGGLDLPRCVEVLRA